MERKLYYATTNKHKSRRSKWIFGKKYGFNIEIIDPDFEMLEVNRWFKK